jgi:hypothetical protein
MSPFQDAVFLTKFNQTEHDMEFYLDSGDDSSDSLKYPINPNAIVNLNIEDSLSNWVVRGTLTFFFNPEVDETVQDPNIGQLTKQKGSYQFRGDGNDRLRIRIFPKLTQPSDPKAPILKISNKTHWTLSYLFSIYDMEDVDLPPGAQNQASATIKCIKLYFWDEWYQKMISNVIEYSTAKSNTDQTIKSGIAMKEIIEKALKGVASTRGVPTGSVTQGLWEEGQTDLFFTAPAQYNSFECLEYVHDRHLSNVSHLLPNGQTIYDYSFLMKERGEPNADVPESVGFLALRPLSYFFEKAGKDNPGEFQIEHFFLQGYTDPIRKPTKTYKAPISSNDSDTVDFKSLKYGMISNYRFVDIAPSTNTLEFNNRPVYSFDFKNRLYRVEFEANTVESAREFMVEKYIKNLYKNENADLKKLFLINLNKEKQDFKNTRVEFSLLGGEEYLSARQADGIHKLLYIGVFQNACINFRTMGSTNREPGRFIAIDRTEGVEDGDFQNKFFGQWFVINVKHIFESEFYYNDITAVKIHSFDTLKRKFPNTY